MHESIITFGSIADIIAKELDPNLTSQMDYYISELEAGRIPN